MVQVEIFPDDNIINELLSYPPDELARVSQIMAAQKGRLRPQLKLFSIDYTERNIDIFPLMDIKIQTYLIEIISSLKLINQEIDHFGLTLEKTFNPEIFTLNEQNINTNIDNSIILLSKALMKIADKITKLLLLIRESQYNNPAIKLRKLISKLIEFIKKRRF